MSSEITSSRVPTTWFGWERQHVLPRYYANSSGEYLVYNHGGNGDNVLNQYDRNIYYDGDTDWGPLVNYDSDVARHFFVQNAQSTSPKNTMSMFFALTIPAQSMMSWAQTT